jgi:transposase InsO family protein
VKYAFVWRHRWQFSIARLCSALGVSRSGFYDWLNRPESRHASEDRDLLRAIRALHVQARQAYGAYKTWKVLNATGIVCGRHRVARLRRQNGIEALRQRRFRVMSEHHKFAPPAPNLLKQNFTVMAPNRVWAGDMTVVATGAGWLHLAVVLDLFSRRVVGWAMGNKRDQVLGLSALKMAFDQRRPGAGLIHHSDRGSAYVGVDYQAKLHQIGAEISMSGKGNCYDNAVVESFFGNLKNELVHHCRFVTREEARARIFDYIEVFYNRQRAHATLRFLSPVAFENLSNVALQPCPGKLG